MSKEALIKLNKYADDLRNKMSAPLSAKQKKRPTEFKQFLERELKAVTTKIDALKLTEPSKK